MSKQNWVAILLAAVAALLSWYYLSERESELKTGATPIKVLVARKPIARGAALTEDRVAIEEIPGAYVMPGAISAATPDEVKKQWGEFKDQFALVPLAKGEQVLPNKLSRLRPGFAGLVPEGMRIAAFNLDAASAVGGQVKPGNRVDVLGTFEHQYQGAKCVTSVVLVQDVLVTAVGAETVADRAKDKSSGASANSESLNVCLALSPEDTVRLSLSEHEGRLKLALRAAGDENLLDLANQNLGTVLGPLMRVRQDEIKSTPKRIQIIKGME